MKGEISTWHLILIAVAVITALTTLYITNNVLESIFTDALESAFD